MASGPISRILCGVRHECDGRCGDHSSGPTIARRLKRPTRARVGADKRFREQHESRTVLGGIGRQDADFLQGPLTIECDWGRLHDGHRGPLRSHRLLFFLI